MYLEGVRRERHGLAHACRLSDARRPAERGGSVASAAVACWRRRSPPRLELPPLPRTGRGRSRARGAELGVERTRARAGARPPRARRARRRRAPSSPPRSATTRRRSPASTTRSRSSSRTSRRGTRITVHGDYDVDGVCSTAILVRALRALGRRRGLVPARAAPTTATGCRRRRSSRLAARGTRLLVTADCAITAVEEVALARGGRACDVVVTDHHTPRADGALPDAPIVHPGARRGYPCPELCAAAVAYKLAAGAVRRGRGATPASAEHDLDLVALATVADVVPLRGENRAPRARGPARAGGDAPSRACARCMRVARVDPSAARRARRRLPAGAAHQRRRPPVPRRRGRRAAAHRGRRARARRSPPSSTPPTRERRAVEERTTFEAERRSPSRRWPSSASGPAATCSPREGWHPGVVGIVASRIAERHHRPAVLIALDGDDRHGLGAQHPRLRPARRAARLRRAARALRRPPRGRRARDPPRAASTPSAPRSTRTRPSVLEPEDLVPRRARRRGRLRRRAGHRAGRGARAGSSRAARATPSVTLLVPAATLEDPRPMGEGQHVRFSRPRAARARRRCPSARRGCPAKPGVPVDATVRLEPQRVDRGRRAPWSCAARAPASPRRSRSSASPATSSPPPSPSSTALPPRPETSRTHRGTGGSPGRFGRVVDRRGAGIAGA